jgi:hypothetical protein
LADEELIREDIKAYGFRIKKQTLVKLNEEKAVKYLKIPYQMKVNAVRQIYMQYEQEKEDAEIERRELPAEPEETMPEELTPDELDRIHTKAKQYCRGPMLVMELEIADTLGAIAVWKECLGGEEDAAAPILEDEGEESKDDDGEKTKVHVLFVIPRAVLCY